VLVDELLKDRCQNRVGISKYVTIPKPYYMEAHASQKGSTAFVPRFLVGVLSAIEFDYKSSAQAAEIGDVGTDGMLPAELEPKQPSITKQTPHPSLGVRGLSAKVAGQFSANLHPRSPSPPPSPAKRERGSE
jgi:hypothetical protein